MMAELRPYVLTFTPLPPAVREKISTRFTLIDESSFEADKSRARAIVTNGKRGARAEEIENLPQLRLVLTIGVGFESVDLDALKRRNIPLITGRGTNEDGVADHAIALLLASGRGLLRYDQQVKGGAKANVEPTSFTNKTLGIVGLGEIGLRIARRAEAFGLKIAYHNRRRRDDAPYLYHESVRALAAASDFLIVSAPGGAATYHLIGKSVLDALGPRGHLVNIGRGEIVDTAALIQALHRNAIAGAAIDVFEGEPDPPAEFASLSNLIVTPHIAAASPERVIAMGDHLLRHLTDHLLSIPSQGVSS